MANKLSIVPFAPVHASAFKTLNLNWIRVHWEPEPADFKALDHPAKLIEAGGHIFIATADDQVVGTCALLKMDETCFELAKMAVADQARGLGVGRLLGEAVITKARELGAARIYLESNTVLEPAINLYTKLGFQRITGPTSPYARCNIQMELTL
jgi:GNAT superfamily N-acetyltransferase